LASTALPDLFASRDAPARERLRKSINSDPNPLLRALAVRHSDLLLASISRFAPDPEDAYDLLHDVWLLILRKGSSYTGSGSFLGWVLSVARNTCLSSLRRPDRRYLLQSTGTIADDLSAGTCCADVQTPDVVAERQELWRAVNRAIQNLAPRQRAVVVLRLVEGRSTREAAAELGCSTGTIKGSLFRAKRQLQRELAQWRT